MATQIQQKMTFFFLQIFTVAGGTALSLSRSWMAAVWGGTQRVHTLTGHLTCLMGTHRLYKVSHLAVNPGSLRCWCSPGWTHRAAAVETRFHPGGELLSICIHFGLIFTLLTPVGSCKHTHAHTHTKRKCFGTPTLVEVIGLKVK